jgi:hypothetical protein
MPLKNPWTQTPETLASTLKVDFTAGLSEEAVEKSRSKYGKNGEFARLYLCG